MHRNHVKLTFNYKRLVSNPFWRKYLVLLLLKCVACWFYQLKCGGAIRILIELLCLYWVYDIAISPDGTKPGAYFREFISISSLCYNIILLGFLSRSIPCFILAYLLKILHLLHSFRLSSFICIIFSNSKIPALTFSFSSCHRFVFGICSRYIEWKQPCTLDWAFRYFRAGMQKHT